jgi:hypothetical protein
MRRSKRLKIVRISLAMAVAAIIPVTAQAKPIPASGVGSEREYRWKAVPIQALGVTGVGSEGEYRWKAVPIQGLGVTGVGSEGEYRWKAVPIPETATRSSDDRPFSRAPILEGTQVTSDGGSTFDINPYVVSGLGVAFLLALGMALAIRHNRKTKLSPA